MRPMHPSPPETSAPSRNRLACDVDGEGRPVVVVPWGPGSYGTLFRWALHPLAERYQLVHWDYRGCGKSSKAPRYTMEDDLWDLASLIEALELDRPVLLGHSYGAMLALYLALEYPQHVGGLVLVNGMASARPLKASRARRKEFLTPRRYVQWEQLGYRCIGGEASGEEKLKYLEGEARFLLHDEAHLLTLMRHLRLDFHVLASVQESLQAFDVSKRLKQLDVPVLVTAGAHDRVAADEPKAMHLALKGSAYRRFANSGHLPFVEERDAFCQLVGDWLDEHPPAAPKDA